MSRPLRRAFAVAEIGRGTAACRHGDCRVMNLCCRRAAAMKLNPLMVRYIVDDVDAAIAFYTERLGFRVTAQSGPHFAIVERENLQLVLSPPKGPGGGSQPMPDGRQPEPGGWNRIIVQSSQLDEEVAMLKKGGAKFRNDIVAGPGGRQILLEDPSGNAVELFESAGD
jgi:catechol 2,3-dioxygenase-like lactoylglutathione lyase family enzyme